MARNTSLKHDAQGFLVGDPVDLGTLLAVWQGIRDDVRAIRQAVLGIESAARDTLSDTPARVAEPAGRGERSGKADPAVKAVAEVAQPIVASSKPDGVGGDASRRQQGVADAAEAIVRTVGNPHLTLPTMVRASVEPVRRDERGRFVQNNDTKHAIHDIKRSADDTQQPADNSRHDNHSMHSVSERIADTIKEAVGRPEDSGPTAKAMVESVKPIPTIPIVASRLKVEKRADALLHVPATSKTNGAGRESS